MRSAAADPRIRVIERDEQRPHRGRLQRRRWPSPAASSSPCSTTTTSCRPQALERDRRGHRARARRRLPLHRRGQDRPGRRTFDDFRKPAWSPERLRGHMYTCHFSVLRTSLVARRRRVPRGLRGLPGPRPRAAGHRAGPQASCTSPRSSTTGGWVPGSAAGDPDAKPYAWVAGVKAVQAHLDRVGIDATAELRPRPQHLPDRRAVSTRRCGSAWSSRRAAPTAWSGASAAVLRRRGGAHRCSSSGGHDNLEIVVVHDAGTPPGCWTELRDVAAAPAAAGPLRPAVRLQREVQPRRPGRPRRRRGAAQRRHRDRLRRLPRPAGRPAVRGGRRHDGVAASYSRRPHPERRVWPSTAARARAGRRAARSPAGRSWSVSRRAPRRQRHRDQPRGLGGLGGLSGDQEVALRGGGRPVRGRCPSTSATWTSRSRCRGRLPARCGWRTRRRTTSRPGAGTRCRRGEVRGSPQAWSCPTTTATCRTCPRAAARPWTTSRQGSGPRALAVAPYSRVRASRPRPRCR